MTLTTHSLDGADWVIRESLDDMWEWYVARGAPALNSVSNASVVRARGWLPARVPGAVLDDLMRAGEVDDPRVGRQSRAAEWAASRSSWTAGRVRPNDAGPSSIAPS